MRVKNEFPSFNFTWNTKKMVFTSCNNGYIAFRKSVKGYLEPCLSRAVAPAHLKAGSSAVGEAMCRSQVGNANEIS